MKKERVASFIFFLTGVYGLIFSLSLPMGRLSEPGAGVFPLIVSLLLLLAGTSMFFAGTEKAFANGFLSFLKEQKVPFLIILITVVFIFLLEILGYVVTASLYIFLLFSVVSRYKWSFALTCAGLIGIVSWYIFDILLETPLPKGIFPF